VREHPCYSSVSAYLRCPAEFREAYVLKYAGFERDNLKHGREVHEAAAEYAKGCFPKRKAFDAALADSISLAYQEPVRTLFREWAEDWRWEWGSVVFGEASPVEQQLWGTLPGGQRFSGHVDLLQRREGAAEISVDPFGEGTINDLDIGGGDLWVVTDFKTRAYGDFDEAEAPLQQRIYPWLVQQNREEARVFHTRIVAFARGAWSPKPWVLTGDLSYIGAELQAICDRIDREEDFDATPGTACLSCLHTLSCPCHDNPTLLRITGETAEGRLKRMIWHEAQIATMKMLLKEDVKSEGEVWVGNQGWGERMGETSYQTEYPLELLKLAMEAGEDLQTARSRLPGWARVWKLDKDNLRGWMAKPEWGDRVSALVREKQPGKPTIGALKRTGDETEEGNAQE